MELRDRISIGVPGHGQLRARLATLCQQQQVRRTGDVYALVQP
jgi:hypothetical protein